MAPTPAPVPQLVGDWKLDPIHSVAFFTARHLGVGNVSGTIPITASTLQLGGGDIEGASVTATLDAIQIETRNRRRNAHVRSADFLDVENHPTIHFASTAARDRSGEQFILDGELTIRGTTRPISLTANLIGTIHGPDGLDRVGFTATGTLDRRSFGVNFPAVMPGGFSLVSDRIEVSIEAEYTRSVHIHTTGPAPEESETTMPGYGHDLLFGLFATPSSTNIDAVVELAERSDRAGLDLITFQDHPYQPALIDTWTLMSFIGARTNQIRIASNVINLPLRSPSVLARSAAGLDLLTKGRFELGLGAGGFWDAIAAMGGTRRTPGESVAQLREAIPIIRQLWDTTERGGVRVEGDYYSIAGAKRGPKPAHDIGIWIGAYGPRMLALTGELGDGWLPSLEYRPEGLSTLTDMNRRIDDAAVAAGRTPQAVRRLLNIMNVAITPTSGGFLQGPVEQWIDQLTEASATYGLSGFLIGGDDPRTAEILAQEIAPAVRANLAA